MPKRALFLCPSPFEVGTYYRAYAFARHLAAKGLYEIDLLCTGESDQEAQHGNLTIVQTALLGPSLLPLRGWNFGEIWKRFRFLNKSRARYDLIYSFEYQPNVWALAAPLAKRQGAVHFNDWCGWYAGRHHQMKGIRVLQKLDAWMEEYPRKRVDCLTVICSSLHERALSCGVDPKKLMMVREGAETSGPLVPRAEARKRLGITDTDFLVLSMSDQGHGTLVEAIERLAASRPGSKLVITGNAKDLPSSHPHLISPGRVSDEELHLWLCAADCAWLATPNTPLNRGRLPHKIGHFRVYGLPLVTTGVSDVTLLGDSGTRIVNETATDFAEDALQRPLLEDVLRTQFAENARQIFSWDRILEPLTQRVLESV